MSAFALLALPTLLCWQSNTDLAAQIRRLGGTVRMDDGEPPQVRLLDLSFRKADDAVIEKCKGQSRLKELYLRNTPITDEGGALLVSFPQLKSLDLSSTKVGNRTMWAISRLPSLEELWLYDTKIQERDLELLSRAANLKTLSIGAVSGVSDKVVSALSSLNRLETLDIQKTTVTDKGLDAIRHLPKLQYLNLDGTLISDVGLGRFEIDFVSLHLSRTKVTEKSVRKTVKRSKSLSELFLSGTDVDDETIGEIGNLSNLRVLDLSYTRITTNGLSRLRNPKLELLHLEGCQLADQAIEELARLKTLRSLMVRNTGIGGEAIRKLIAALPKCEIEWR